MVEREEDVERIGPYFAPVRYIIDSDRKRSLSVLSFPIPVQCGWKTNLDIYSLDLELAKDHLVNQLDFLQDYFETNKLLEGEENAGKHVAFSLSGNVEIFEALHEFCVNEYEIDFSRDEFCLKDHIMTFLRKEIVCKK